MKGWRWVYDQTWACFSSSCDHSLIRSSTVFVFGMLYTFATSNSEGEEDGKEE